MSLPRDAAQGHPCISSNGQSSLWTIPGLGPVSNRFGRRSDSTYLHDSAAGTTKLVQRHLYCTVPLIGPLDPPPFGTDGRWVFFEASSDYCCSVVRPRSRQMIDDVYAGRDVLVQSNLSWSADGGRRFPQPEPFGIVGHDVGGTVWLAFTRPPREKRRSPTGSANWSVRDLVGGRHHMVSTSVASDFSGTFRQRQPGPGAPDGQTALPSPHTERRFEPALPLRPGRANGHPGRQPRLVTCARRKSVRWESDRLRRRHQCLRLGRPGAHHLW